MKSSFQINFKALSKNISLFARKHSPEILTGLGVIGLISTTVTAVRATPKALELIEENKDEDGHISKKDVVKVAWKQYVPSVLIGTVSIACIVGSNKISIHRSALLAAACSISEEKLKEYKNKVVDVFGKKKEKEDVYESIIQDKIDESPTPNCEPKKSDDILFYDVWSGRYFYSDRNRVDRAINELNSYFLQSDQVCLNDFYDSINLDRNQFGYICGWGRDTTKLIEIRYSSHIAKDGNPCLAIDFFKDPTPFY